MAVKGKTVIINLQVDLSEESFANLTSLSKANSPQESASLWAKFLLDNYVNGGMMLTPSDLQTIEKSAGLSMSGPGDIISAIQASAGRDGGQYTVKASIEPAFWPHLEESASARGMAPSELLSELINYAVSEGWLYEWEPDGLKWYLSRSVRDRYERVMKRKTVTEADFLEMLAIVEDKLSAKAT